MSVSSPTTAVRPAGRAAVVAVYGALVAFATAEGALSWEHIPGCPDQACFPEINLTASLLLAASWLCCAGIILFRAERTRVTAFLAITLAVQAINALGTPALDPWPTLQRIVPAVALTAGFVGLAVFPEGWARRWLRWVAVAFATVSLISAADGSSAANTVQGAAMFLAFGSLLVAHVRRYRRDAGASERDQVGWLLLGLFAWFATNLLLSLPYFLPAWSGNLISADSPYDRLQTLGSTLSIALIPISLTIAVVRSQIYDVHLLAGRAFVYATLTVVVGALYLGAVLLGATLGDQRGWISPLLGAAIVAMVFQPIRSRLQAWARRRIYGLRAEPHAAMRMLVATLAGATSDRASLDRLAQTIQGSLRVPFVAIRVEEGGTPALVAEVGEPTRHLVDLPLTHQGERIGTLVVGVLPGDNLAHGDLQLLEDLAAQSAPVVQGVRLSERLQASRERLVTAREEERRRLQRDLHDELAPTLAAAGLTAGTARDLVTRDPEAAAAALARLEISLAGAVADLRRLAHQLRPPILDQHGLADALREHARGLDSALRVEVIADSLPPLPAAVEVAAYRICLEALHNVVRHSRAESCQLRLSAGTDGLTLSLSDDGVGAAPDFIAGVGTISMRERAAELGGRAHIGPAATGGTCVEVCLPLRDGQAADNA